MTADIFVLSVSLPCFMSILKETTWPAAWTPLSVRHDRIHPIFLGSTEFSSETRPARHKPSNKSDSMVFALGFLKNKQNKNLTCMLTFACPDSQSHCSPRPWQLSAWETRALSPYLRLRHPLMIVVFVSHYPEWDQMVFSFF